MAAKGLGDLDTEDTGAAAAAVDEDLVAGLDIRGDALVRCLRRHAEAAAGLEAHPLRQLDDNGVLRGHSHVLAQRAPAGWGHPAKHALANAEIADLRANGRNRTREVHQRRRRHGNDAAGDEAWELGKLIIGRVKRGGIDLDQNAVATQSAGRKRERQLLQLDGVLDGRCDRAVLPCSHHLGNVGGGHIALKQDSEDVAAVCFQRGMDTKCP